MVMYQTSKAAVARDFELGTATKPDERDERVAEKMLRAQTRARRRCLPTSFARCQKWGCCASWTKRKKAEDLTRFQRVPGTLRLFDRKEYYSAHGEDALYGPLCWICVYRIKRARADTSSFAQSPTMCIIPRRY